MRLNARQIRLAYLIESPVVYQVPLLRRLAREPDLSIRTFYRSPRSTTAYEGGFGFKFRWDVPLLGGYESEFLPAIGSTDRPSFWKPLNYGLAKRLRLGQFDALWIHGYAFAHHLMAVVNAKRLGLRILLRDEVNRLSSSAGSAKLMLKRTLFAMLARVCDGFLTIGTLNRDYYRHHGVPDKKLFLVPYAVDNTVFEAAPEKDSPTIANLRAKLAFTDAGRPIIMAVARMLPRKRFHDLLEAYIRLSPDGVREPNAYLVFGGDGSERKALEQRALETGWHSIRFVGVLNRSELPAFYRLADIFVLPSILETWGLVVNEAMSAGCAILVSDRVGCGPDLVKPGRNGYTFRATDISDLSRRLKELVDDPNRRKTMGAESHAIIKDWSFEQDVSGLMEALTAVLA